jgi:hypothetical protein
MQLEALYAVAVNRWRPFSLLLLSTDRPVRVRFRSRKPWTRLRRSRLG